MTLNPFKGSIRKVKAAYIVGGAITFLSMFGVDVDAELKDILVDVVERMLPLIPAVVAYYTKMNVSDVDKLELKKG
jgi:hypothetical protein